MSAPLPFGASMTSTPSDNPEMIRLRLGKWRASGGESKGSSLTIAPRPLDAMRSYSSTFSGGYTCPRPQPCTTIVDPPACSAASWQAVSIPRAPPETTVIPRCAMALAKRRACSIP